MCTAAADQNTVASVDLDEGAWPLPVALLCGGPRVTDWEVGGAGAIELFLCFSTMMCV